MNPAVSIIHNGSLVIVPCGKAKIWDRNLDIGPTCAANAYIGTPFHLNVAYATMYGDRWMILSAKYGFIPPDFVIPGPYDVSFNRKSSNPVPVEVLRQQVDQFGLHTLRTVIGLGGKAYRAATAAAFAGTQVKLQFPFEGLALGRTLQAIRRSLNATS